ncbi:phosphoglycolate phosphatase [Shewanella sedimentimangrovi]|uniref:Phosphoglycolate phosphatase n=1 Tax=Shewanella sedimentimangrovi TaxID=2814293 RepID=A0ABX7R007_9GAMM|nr:phosphoglycolate phosphatase [Shewanella sedimentimangrovi]QSX37029.1 phosphoglycolate phosphatase [Shewanella sedimentimangrovi]
MSQRLKAIAFDLDGTLVDSVPDLAAATNCTLSQLGHKTCSEHEVRTWVGNGARVLLSRAMSHALGREVSEAELNAAMPVFFDFYEQHLERHSRLYPDVIETLTALRQRGLKLAVVTNKPHRFTLPLLRAFGLEELFELVLGGDSLAKMKPDPLPLEHVRAHWSLERDELLMVGDSRNDILAAKAAGIASFGLTYGYNYGEDIGLCGPEAVCNSFTEILSRLDAGY